MTLPQFKGFPSISRLNRRMVITEKLDGTNAQIYIDAEGNFFTGSRNRWITPEDDNYGFSRWAHNNKEELMKLGEGQHFGEWWGAGIQRRYGIPEKRFSLFNTNRWNEENKPACCHIVPVLYDGDFTQYAILNVLGDLEECGSEAAKGFKKPEGIVIYHTASNTYFKVTFENDDKGKSFHEKK